MIRFKMMRLVRRGALLAVGATLFAVPAAAAEADSVLAAHPSCTGLILNEVTSNAQIGFYYKNDGFRNLLSPGNTWNGTVDRPIDRFQLSYPAKVDYYDLRSWRFLGSHTNVQPGIYAKDPCHLALVYVYP